LFHLFLLETEKSIRGYYNRNLRLLKMALERQEEIQREPKDPRPATVKGWL
jgi:hypothetical protein